MRRHVLLALPLCLVFAPAARAGIPTSHYTLTTRTGEYLTVEDGKLVVGKKTRPTARDETKAAPDRWVVAGGKIRSSTSGLYLTYDPQDKEGKVFLADKPVKGAEWVVREGKGKPRNEKYVDGEWGTIEAGSGPMKGWRLEGDYQNEQGKDVRLALSKEPKRDVEVVRLYTHK